MPNQRHSGTGDNVTGDQTKIERQIIQGSGSTYIEHAAPEQIFPKELTARIPKTAPDKIVSRDAELDDLHHWLFDNKQVVLVNGMGGISKTTLAQVYTAKYWDEYRHVVWVSQVSQDVINDFVNTEGLLDSLNIRASGIQEAKDLFINIMTGLKKMDDQPNLLIIDNADVTLGSIYDYLPQTSCGISW